MVGGGGLERRPDLLPWELRAVFLRKRGGSGNLAII